MWIKRFKISEEEKPQIAVTKEYIIRIMKRDHSLISRQAKEYKISFGKKLRRLQLKNPLLTNGINHLTKIRTGSFQFVNKLIFNKKLDRQYLNKCIFYKKKIIEDTKHLFIYCKAWEKERRKYLKITTLESQPDDLRSVADMEKFISIVLGGNKPASGWKPAELLPASCRFLSAIAKKRKAIIADVSDAIH